MSLGIHQIVANLVATLGLSLVATISGVKETRAVQQWTDAREPQRPQVLRFALQLTLMIVDIADASTARAWFQGSNPYLDDRSPAIMLRTLALEDVQAPLMAAARAFASRCHGESHSGVAG